ncbi:MAG: sulfate adenylyltransferase subunit CysN [Sneathiella sp.]|uniref:sulfate adenylyltransferase subunit CysN n=1 Tax=Sneathiella sp. TaxID=1964365 RepID=UPI0030019EBA
MSTSTETAKTEIDDYLKSQEQKDLLRFITCGSVDDGKSTFIGRLLWDTKLLFEDQLATLTAESKRIGTQGGNIDYALLLDGLQAEREQGITIDVAYRFFTTDKRKFIVADTPGHEQYTRNMVTGASTADLAVILVDARKGMLTQTMRHSYLVSLLGIKKIVLAINKMDLVDYDEAIYTKIKADYEAFARQLNFETIQTIAVSALNGDNMIALSPAMPWYQGPTILEYLETVDFGRDVSKEPFRLPVQWVNRPNLDFRGFSGTIASGTVLVGDAVVEPVSGQASTVSRIVTFDGDLETAQVGQAVTLTLTDEIDISRGDVLCQTTDRPATADQFSARVVWMHDTPMLPGRNYLIKIGTSLISSKISDLKYKVNVNTLEHMATKTLELNEIGICNITLDKAVSFDPYVDNRQTGSFILIDRYTNATVAAGTIDFALRRADNIHWQSVDIHKAARSSQKDQKASVLWFTGLSGSGKSTIANLVEKKLHTLNKHTYLLDGDNVRHGLNKDLGFTDADRVENIRRVGETSRLLVDAGLITLVSFISPFRSERQMARSLLEDGEFLEVFVDTPLEICEERDIKGLYKKARAGEIKNFTGIDSAYERPENAELVIDGAKMSAEDAAAFIVDSLQKRGLI